MARIFEPEPGLPTAVFRDKYARQRKGGGAQTFAERVRDVIEGNLALVLDPPEWERERLHELAASGVMAFAGRHLQHGDVEQPLRTMEYFTNCATAPLSFINFWLLLKGCGVGRSYDDALCLVDWRHLPNVRVALSRRHPDFRPGLEAIEQTRSELAGREGVHWIEVADSGEGWAKAVELLETAAWERRHRDSTFAFDLTAVRPAGSSIAGQQNRGSSGPIALMTALRAIGALRSQDLPCWKQALLVDHYLTRCVLAGGTRRGARIATKNWRDPDILDFIALKRTSDLETANHSVAVDAEFWRGAAQPGSRAHEVFHSIASILYHHASGDPGFINVDRLSWNGHGLEGVTPQTYFGEDARAALAPTPATERLIANVLRAVKSARYPFLTNPCGEIVLSAAGGYCVVGDICLANAKSTGEIVDAVRLMARFLIRVNRMPCLYDAEVQRTNRIGVSLTGIHEAAHRLFNLDFRTLCDEQRSQRFWSFLAELRCAAETEALSYSAQLGMVAPHTVTTIKPSGTVSKIMSCTEGAHLPALDYYIRWVQYPAHDDRVRELRDSGYPVRKLHGAMADKVVIGFPSRLPLADEIGDRLMVASDASIELQYTWLQLLERYWLGGAGRNNQVSYTLKYDPSTTDYAAFSRLLLEHQPRVRACALMPALDAKHHPYLPEERISAAEHRHLVARIRPVDRTGIADALSDCDAGACDLEPTSFQ